MGIAALTQPAPSLTSRIQFNISYGYEDMESFGEMALFGGNNLRSFFRGCYEFESFLTIDARGFANYLRRLVPPEVVLSDLNCRMNGAGFGRSRAGYCTFTATPEDFKLITSKLDLRRPESFAVYDGGPRVYKVKGGLDKEGCILLLGMKREGGMLLVVDDQPADLHISAANLPPIWAGNISTSFVRLFHVANSGLICVDLIYPYG